MFMILGLPWIFESVHQLIESNKDYDGEDGEATEGDSPCDNDTFEAVFFRIVSAFNMLRGLLLFLIFPCKATIWKKLMDRFGLNWCTAAKDPRTEPTDTTRLTRGSMELKTFRGPSSRRGSNEVDGVVLTRFTSLNKGQSESRRLSLGEADKRDDKTASLRRQLLAPPAKPRDTKSLNI